MEYKNLSEHLHYEMFFRIDLKTNLEDFCKYQIEQFSDGLIDIDRLSYNVEVDNYIDNNEYGYLNIIPLNEYTKIMLKLNKTGIQRYNKLEKLRNNK